MILPERLRSLLDLRDMSQAALARAVGVTPQAISKIVRGETTDTAKIYAIARALRTTPEYLTGESDEPDDLGAAMQDRRLAYVAQASEPVPQEMTGEVVPVRELDLTFGMGATYMDVPVTEHSRHFSREWLRQYTRSDPENLLFAQGAGDSMFPTLLDSDLMLIDCSQRTLNMTDKIWAVAWNDCGAIKRLRPTRDGGVSIMSDNPNVSDAIAYDDEMHILGRVVAVVRKV
ncbi:LexA family transcriptional regulator [Croceicoccus sp. BE223]|uniref:XRE family transcriptional regulator n=1 Tax=Croceicoccus sp. BE223 TaxID=2817716 RepID=UPI00285E84F6|nr:LexA family transcriptional regulator [Croceicoccus sp. BE223]MDR7101446.1 phage repressor protein C with HTH and peptisase S24 domain [Croceicoccus sp. BE223]